ncbi:hypothetical protein GCM10011344_22340 [Dokdonia pacifica]|uniref:Uncharacterized protein n=1 Tax=Dokdonia pacifica TaxID=1627892 RepID=A0A238WJC9_9FLAO|nr:hypothetical protein [Dokdonia pacifica]GGG21083.1 hypothetical protein GCM10011344_22340 [Dokdonia pacifica]SNR45779.1 hypothetical protein SAMN06265376_1011066 [Dokdonia pacifica]
MCQIRFTVQTTNNMEPILSGQGRYRRIGDKDWTDFSINVSDPMTPDITIIGDYELEVRVSYLTTPTETDWSSWKASTFEIANDCDRSYYYARVNQVIGAL